MTSSVREGRHVRFTITAAAVAKTARYAAHLTHRARVTKNTVKMHDVVGHLRQAIAGARELGIPVLFGPMAYTEEDYADEKLQCRCGINRIMFE